MNNQSSRAWPSAALISLNWSDYSFWLDWLDQRETFWAGALDEFKKHYPLLIMKDNIFHTALENFSGTQHVFSLTWKKAYLHALDIYTYRYPLLKVFLPIGKSNNAIKYEQSNS